VDRVTRKWQDNKSEQGLDPVSPQAVQGQPGREYEHNQCDQGQKVNGQELRPGRLESLAGHTRETQCGAHREH